MDKYFFSYFNYNRDDVSSVISFVVPANKVYLASWSEKKSAVTPNKFAKTTMKYLQLAFVLLLVVKEVEH